MNYFFDNEKATIAEGVKETSNAHEGRSCGLNARLVTSKMLC